jgi:flagellar assembly protein FliH
MAREPERDSAAAAAQLKQLEAARFRYLEAIESLVAHLEVKTYDPTEIVDLATMVAEAILNRTLSADRDLLIERVSEALDELEGERPTRLRLSPMDRQLLAEERPELLARALEIVEDPKIGAGGCIVEGSKRAVDATLEGRLERFARALKQRLIEERDHAG